MVCRYIAIWVSVNPGFILWLSLHCYIGFIKSGSLYVHVMKLCHYDWFTMIVSLNCVAILVSLILFHYDWFTTSVSLRWFHHDRFTMTGSPSSFRYVSFT